MLLKKRIKHLTADADALLIASRILFSVRFNVFNARYKVFFIKKDFRFCQF